MFLLHSMIALNSLEHGQGANGEPFAWAAPWVKIAAHSPFLLVDGALSSQTGLQGLPLKSVLIYCQSRFDTSLNQRCNAHLMRLRKRGQIYLDNRPLLTDFCQSRMAAFGQ